jgi:hypothetical protein
MAPPVIRSPRSIVKKPRVLEQRDHLGLRVDVVG